MEKFGCPKANFGPQTVLLIQCYSAHFILYDSKVPESLRMRSGPKTWPSIQLGFEPRTFGSRVEVMA